MSNNVYIMEAFRELETILEEEDNSREGRNEFNLDQQGYGEMKSFIDEMNADDEEDMDTDIYDLDTEAEDELKQSYLGKIVLNCNVCKSNIFQDKEDVILQSDGDKTVVNIETECPYCMSNEGYTVIGQIEPYSEVDEPEEETEEEEIEIEVIDEPEELEESLKETLDNGKTDTIDSTILDNIFRTLRSNSNEKDFAELCLTDFEMTEEQLQKFCGLNKDGSEHIAEAVDKTGTEKLMGNKSISGDKKLNSRKNLLGRKELTGHPTDDSLHENKESKSKSIVKEEVETVTVETEDNKITVDATDDGVKVETQSTSNSDAKGDEMIGEVPEDMEDIIEENTKRRIREKELAEQEEANLVIDEIDLDEFDNLSETYFKECYENVKSYKTVKGKSTTNGIMLEGVIAFDSGKDKKTTFVFEAVSTNKANNKIRFEGYNKQISAGNKSFRMNANLIEKRIVPKTFNYNYTGKNELNESVKLYGTIQSKKDKQSQLSKLRRK